LAEKSRPHQPLGIGQIDGPEGLTIYTSIMLQHEAVGRAMGLYAEPMSEEENVLLEEEVLPAISRFIERAQAIW
jgi:hypothetical protein